MWRRLCGALPRTNHGATPYEGGRVSFYTGITSIGDKFVIKLRGAVSNALPTEMRCFITSSGRIHFFCGFPSWFEDP